MLSLRPVEVPRGQGARGPAVGEDGVRVQLPVAARAVRVVAAARHAERLPREGGGQLRVVLIVPAASQYQLELSTSLREFNSVRRRLQPGRLKPIGGLVSKDS